jgi:hypothetical protein
MGLLDPRPGNRHPLTSLSLPVAPQSEGLRSPVGWLPVAKASFPSKRVNAGDSRDLGCLPPIGTLPSSREFPRCLPHPRPPVSRRSQALSDAITPPWAFAAAEPSSRPEAVFGHVFAARSPRTDARTGGTRPPFTLTAFPFWGARRSVFEARCRLSTSATATTHGHRPELFDPHADGGRNPLPCSASSCRPPKGRGRAGEPPCRLPQSESPAPRFLPRRGLP